MLRCRLWGHRLRVTEREETYQRAIWRRIGAADFVGMLDLNQPVRYQFFEDATRMFYDFSCARCSTRFETLCEGESLSKVWVSRWPELLDCSNCVTLGPLRRFWEGAVCQLFGHDEHWERDIVMRTWTATCHFCGREGTRLGDRQIRDEGIVLR